MDMNEWRILSWEERDWRYIGIRNKEESELSRGSSPLRLNIVGRSV